MLKLHPASDIHVRASNCSFNHNFQFRSITWLVILSLTEVKARWASIWSWTVKFPHALLFGLLLSRRNKGKYSSIWTAFKWSAFCSYKNSSYSSAFNQLHSEHCFSPPMTWILFSLCHLNKGESQCQNKPMSIEVVRFGFINWSFTNNHNLEWSLQSSHIFERQLCC